MYCLSNQNGKLVAPSDMRPLKTGSSPMPFMELADFDRDGMTDIAFTSETGVLTVLFN